VVPEGQGVKESRVRVILPEQADKIAREGRYGLTSKIRRPEDLLCLFLLILQKAIREKQPLII